MRSRRLRSSVLVVLTLIVVTGLIVPSVFHDTWGEGPWTHQRNRLTGDVSNAYFSPRMDCLSWGRPSSVFGD